MIRRFFAWLRQLFSRKPLTPEQTLPLAVDKYYHGKLLKRAAKYRRRREAWNRNLEGQKRRGSQAVLRDRRAAGRLQELADGILSQQRMEVGE